MGLLNKIFKGPDKGGPDSEPLAGSRFEQSDDREEGAYQREASRRELVKLVLRETMRRHAIPSDWIECRLLPVVTSKRSTGLHVQLVVKQGQGSLLRYIPAFQSGLMAEVEKYDPRAWDWLLSISWQFAGITSSTGGHLPGADEWAAGTVISAPAPLGDARALHEADEDVAEDLKALFAIRDAVLKTPAAGPDDRGEPDFEPTRPFGFPPSNGGPLR